LIGPGSCPFHEIADRLLLSPGEPGGTAWNTMEDGNVFHDREATWTFHADASWRLGQV
jgi:hypothetical protein